MVEFLDKIADKVCKTTGYCTQVAPKGSPVAGETNKTVTRSVTPQQAINIGQEFNQHFKRLHTSPIASVQIEEPKNQSIILKDFIMKLEHKPQKPDDSYHQSKSTEYVKVKNGTWDKNVRLDIEKTKGLFCTTVDSTVTEPFVSITKSTATHTFKNSKVEPECQGTTYKECTLGVCYPASEKEYRTSLDSIPKFNVDGELK